MARQGGSAESKTGAAAPGSSRPSALLNRIETDFDNFTRAERVIATFLLGNRNLIAFETAESLAKKLGVSAVTVGRFCRRIGYSHFRALKDDLRIDASEVPWLVGDALAAYVAGGSTPDQMQRSLRLEVAGLVEVYGLVGTPKWDAMVKIIAHAGHVHVIGFQSERGIAAHFAHLLQYIRPRVHLVDDTAGNYADVLAEDPASRCLVLFETRRYSTLAYRLCESAQAAGIEVVVVTDKYCEWAPKFSRHVLALSTETELFCKPMTALASVSTLLCNAVVAELGTGIEQRLEAISGLYQRFTGHVGHLRAGRANGRSPRG